LELCGFAKAKAAWQKRNRKQRNCSEMNLLKAESINAPDPVVKKLQTQIRQLETAARREHGPVVSTGCDQADQMLPDGGLERGTITEWICDDRYGGGSGAAILSLIAARNACARIQHKTSQPQSLFAAPNHRTSKRRWATSKPSAQTRRKKTISQNPALVIIDPEQVFYPPAAAKWGISLDNTVIIRCREPSKIMWAIQQALQCPAVGAVWGCLPNINQRWSRRFQLAAEQSGTMAMFVRPQIEARTETQTSWAEVQWTIQPCTAPIGHSSHSRQIQLRLHRIRSGSPGATVKIEVDFTTGHLHSLKTTQSLTRTALPTPETSTPDRRSQNEPAQRTFRKRIQKPDSLQTHPVRMAAQLAHSANRRPA